jgi:hypothetical protein
MKTKLRSLFTALNIGNQMPHHRIKARQLRSFFEEVGRLDFGTGHEALVRTDDGVSYTFTYLNPSQGIDIHVEAVIGEETQTVKIERKTISED